jgi:thioredoxin reductase
MPMYDAVVVGGGPAGLSAALQLGRARRSTVVVDAGEPRNAAATEVHGLLGMDGVPPAELRQRGADELARYGVERRAGEVVSVDRGEDAFVLRLGDGTLEGRRVLLATGLVDVRPDLPDVGDFWGTAVLQCPFCHGWEVADRPLGFVAAETDDLSTCRFYGNWSRELTVFTAGRFEVPDELVGRLDDWGVRLETSPIEALHGEEGRLDKVELEDGRAVACEALFLHPEQKQTPVVERLGVEVNPGGFVAVPKDYGAPPDDARRVMETSVRGVFAAGDLTSPAQSAVMATFEGALAGQMMLMSLLGD